MNVLEKEDFRKRGSQTYLFERKRVIALGNCKINHNFIKQS